MLEIIGLNLLLVDLIFVSKSKIIHKAGNNKLVRIKFSTKMIKVKNLAKFQPFGQKFETDFLISKARLSFNKLS